MNLSPSPSQGLIPLRLYIFLSQVVRHAPLALGSCPVHPARLLRSDNRRVRQPESATNWIQHHVNMA
ncbi:unnamed protein product [Penicillium salamii]|uniref:Uncharacterized protein n=1 Tax=Penicillium salamii TaxID=1612424 RepID=A0A9W4NFR9_9EURO|nr:unnamed protein product [Penicillium salamii]CAG8008012.1 unnamed protein product [Penicillium salamii]CAG8017066.1 unnamed protein product [Penicillium salamii]CAG8044161.1 unnamed protein product [Penicillium salamii]CAG8065026.1 unnamed protein product [Penicillium salamii]